MNFTVILFSIILACIVVYYIVKNHYVASLTKALKAKNYKKVIQVSNLSIANRFVGSYNCDLYRIRAISGLKDEKMLKEEIDSALSKNYPYNQTKNLLEMYFHYYLLKNNKEYAEDMLHKIQEFGEPSFTAFSEQSYAVMLNKQTDLLAVMDAAINTKQYTGFELGVLVYMMGMQYLYLGDKEEARTYFYNSIACFHPAAVYVPVAKKHVKDLSEELGLDLPKY